MSRPFLLVSITFIWMASAVGAQSVTSGSKPDSADCTDINPLHICFQERVLFFEGLVLFGVLMMAVLSGLTCISALNTPTRFQQPKERAD